MDRTQREHPTAINVFLRLPSTAAESGVRVLHPSLVMLTLFNNSVFVPVSRKLHEHHPGFIIFQSMQVVPTNWRCSRHPPTCTPIHRCAPSADRETLLRRLSSQQHERPSTERLYGSNNSSNTAGGPLLWVFIFQQQGSVSACAFLYPQGLVLLRTTLGLRRKYASFVPSSFRCRQAVVGRPQWRWR